MRRKSIVWFHCLLAVLTVYAINKHQDQ